MDQNAIVLDMLKEDNSLKELLNRIYLADCWPYFYTFIAIIWVWIVVWALIVGKSITNTIYFTIFELLINLFMVVDILWKIYLLGWSCYIRQLSNKIELIIGIVWIILYLWFWIISQISIEYYDELIEDLIFIWWCIWQFFRIATLFMNQSRISLVQDEKVLFDQFHDEIEEQKQNFESGKNMSEFSNDKAPSNNMDRVSFSIKLK